MATVVKPTGYMPANYPRNLYPMTRLATTYNFWVDEEIFYPPAKRTTIIKWAGALRSATLVVDINLDFPAQLDNIVLNAERLPGSGGATGAHKSYDVTSIVNNGANILTLNYSWAKPIVANGRVTAYITLDADKPQPPTPPKEPWDWLPLVGFAILGIVGIGVIGYTARGVFPYILPRK